MKKLFLFVVLFLLSLSLVAAVEVTTNKVEYSSGQTVSITVSDCVGASIVEFRNRSGNLVDIRSGEGSWSTSYNTLSDSEDGKYKVEATCTNGAAQENFCLDAPGCMAASSSSSTSSNAGGGSSCTPNWSCNDWSFCGPSLTQTRSCTDLNKCQSAREESRQCNDCEESWVCSLWAACSAGTQVRACYDEHFCESTQNKPGLQKGCNEVDPVPPPARISTQLPPPFSGQVQGEQQNFFSKLWENYKFYLVGGAAALVLA